MAISLAASALFGLFLWLFYAGLFDPGHFATGCPLSKKPIPGTDHHKPESPCGARRFPAGRSFSLGIIHIK